MNLRHFSFSIFRFTFALAFAWMTMNTNAMTTWATLNTEAHPLDATPSDAQAMNYSAYFCTVETAKKLFGGSTVAAIQEYVTYHYATSVPGSTAFTDPYFSDDAYTLDRYDGTVYNSADYVALAFYGDHKFRVYGEGSAQLLNGSLIFDDKSALAGTVGEWTTASYIVPEPSSGLLLLMGWAMLALRRRKS